MSRALILSSLLPVFALGCFSSDKEDSGSTTDGGDGTDGSDGADGTADGTDGTTDTGTEPDPITATLTGTVTVELYCTDSEGGREAVTFADAYAGSFPFGAIWVAAFNEDTGSIEYFGSDTISSPSTTGDAFTIDVSMPAEANVRVYATLDRYDNRILATNDPIGNFPDEIAIVDGGSTSDVDIAIVTEATEYCNGGGTDGGSDGGSGSTINISGPVTIGSFYTTGEGAAMLLDSNGNGPVYYDFFTPTSDPSGYSSTYDIEARPALGQQQLVGAIDSNGNNLFDGMDTWGTYVEVPDVNANPITVGSTDLSGLELQIPLDDGSTPLNTVPYTTISGSVSMNDGSTFDTLTAGSTVYVTALKYRPGTSIAVTSLEADSYDIEEFAWADLTGQSSVSYSMVVPANTIVYLWAYADEDVDGTVNEVGEAVASSGNDANGRAQISTTSSTHNFALDFAVQP